MTTADSSAAGRGVDRRCASTKLVCVFFTADPENGIHAIHWGDAHLEPDRTFTWLYSEQLSVAPQPLV
ncbi:hypothetical protein ABZV61_42195 [Streptomyces sp900116325]|uniref:Uncharacterized protein n=1 Tax=Streptomyces sp. 900116325 TaxID=3154295 RepID=A0ABV2UMR9_9ACTN